MGRGKSGREAAAFSFFPSSIARSRFFLIFFLNAAIFIGIPSSSLCEGRGHHSAQSIRFGSFASDASPKCVDREGLWKRRTVKRQRKWRKVSCLSKYLCGKARSPRLDRLASAVCICPYNATYRRVFSLSDSLRQRKLSGTLIHSCLLDLGPTTALECGLLCWKSNWL